MHKQYYKLCCKNNCCKQDNTQWANFGGCQNFTKDTRNRVCNGPSKGFVQNLKDKIVNLQSENIKPQFIKKPVKKKQTDYYCLMLRKINNLDKKLQNLEHLFTSHINHTPNGIFNSNDNEPFYDYMDFYESVRSLIDLANRLKEDILYKQCDNHVPNRNTLYLNDRIKILDSELKNLYSYLEQLQNCSKYETANCNGKKFYVQDYQDLPRSKTIFRGGPKVENKRCFDFQEFKNTNKNKRKTAEKYNGECENNTSSSQCIECCYEADEETPFSCQCSKCNINEKRRCPLKFFERYQGETIAKNSDCSCVLCINERKIDKKFKKNSVWVCQSTSSCSCEICISNNQKSFNQNHNSARIKIIKPVKKGENEDFFGELQISYHEMEPSQINKKKKQKKKIRRENEYGGDPNWDSIYFHGNGPGSDTVTVSHVKSQDSSILEQTHDKFSKSQHFRTFSPSNNKQTEVNNVIYYELTPDLNIITKKKKIDLVDNNEKEKNVGRNKKARKNQNKAANKKDEIKNNVRSRLHTVNVAQYDTSNKFSQKFGGDKRISFDYEANGESSSENEQMRNVHHSYKNNPEPKSRKKTNGSAGKHLHIKIRKRKDFVEGMTVEENNPKNPKYFTKKNQNTQLYHRKHGGYCHFQDEIKDKEVLSNKLYPNYHSYHGEISGSDSFETLEVYESESDGNSSGYKLFFCSDPNCVEKLDSDELIMLMNKTDLKYREENPYKLKINENVRDLKSDVCEKCTIKEKTITVTPHKAKNKINNGKAKIIYKKEVVECSKCKNNKNEQSSDITRTNTEYNDSVAENDRNEHQKIINKSSNIKYRESNTKHSNHSNCEYEIQIGKDIRNQESKLLVKTVFHSQGTSTTNAFKNINQTNNTVDTNVNNSTTVASCKVNQSTTVQDLNAKNSNLTKVLELPGFGNLININIERGNYSLKQQEDNIETQRNNEKVDSREIRNLDYQNKDSSLETDLKDDNNLGVYSCSVKNVANSKSKNITNPSTQSPHVANNKSFSDKDLAVNNEIKTKQVAIVRSEICTKTVDNKRSSSKTKDDMNILGKKDNIVLYSENVSRGIFTEEAEKRPQSKNNHATKKKDIKVEERKSLKYIAEGETGNTLHAAQGSRYSYKERYELSSNPKDDMNNSGSKDKIVLHPENNSDLIVIEKDEKRTQSKKNQLSTKKDISLKYVTQENSGNALHTKQGSCYTYKERYGLSTNVIAPRKSIVKPRVSTSRLKRSRLKNNKKFGSGLSRVYSAHSIIVQPAILSPGDGFTSKKSNVFNPGRRISKQSKYRFNGYPRLNSLKENSLSGIMKPQMKIVVQESFQKDLKIPSNNSSNARYKVASISNYLSSSVVSESSYSTLNWGKVANKLKEDDTYFNDIA